tara:strand:- start:256 stop:417 length:162 start_codon:yes stop_codon:yes gene_type:complete
MLKRVIQRLVKKHGMKGLLLMIGDWAVKTSKSKDDDKIWHDEVKPFIQEHFNG